MAMKTPGVYVIEKNAFAPAVVEVATAVPAFIGYTKKALNGGRTLHNVPWRISSMSDYVSFFGGAPDAVFAVAGPAAQANGEASKPLQPEPTEARGQFSRFKWNDKVYTVTRAARKAGGRFLMHQALQHFFANGGGDCYIVSVGTFEKDDIAAGGIGNDGVPTGLIGGLVPLLKEQEPTLVLTPDAVLLDEPGCIQVQQAVLQHCGGHMKNRFAILDVWGGDLHRNVPNYTCIDRFRMDIGINHLDFGAAYYPWLNTTLVSPGDIDFRAFGKPEERTGLVALLKADLGTTDANTNDEPYKSQLEALDDIAKSNGQWLDKIKTAAMAAAHEEGKTQEEAREIGDGLEELRGEADQLQQFLAPHQALLHKRLAGMSALYQQILETAREQMNLMPPSAAVAGLYTLVDNSRGVWKAPANMSLAQVVSPAVDISHEEQEDLNVTVKGKSINAIRSFLGGGVLLWGARTLDGNSLDWRYVNVRRTMIMLEESCRLAVKAMAFEPNVGNTWVSIQSMITNFLTGIWKRGGLAGAVPDDAFSVHVGLGQTMTPEDILEGVLRVTVLVALVRPAEFIEFSFQQTMQKP